MSEGRRAAASQRRLRRQISSGGLAAGQGKLAGNSTSGVRWVNDPLPSKPGGLGRTSLDPVVCNVLRHG